MHMYTAVLKRKKCRISDRLNVYNSLMIAETTILVFRYDQHIVFEILIDMQRRSHGIFTLHENITRTGARTKLKV